MTILHLIPTLEGGGAEKQLVILCNELVNRGYDVHIGLRRGGVNLNSLSKKVKVHYLGDYKTIDFRIIVNLLKTVNQIKPHLVQTWLPQMDILGGVVCAVKSIPWIMTERVSELGYRKHKIISKIRLFLAKKSMYIVANSNKGIDYYHKKLPNFNNLKVIKNAVDILVIQKAISENKIVTQKKYILAVGRLVEQKNFKSLIDAISLLDDINDIEVMIFGEGHLLDDLNNYIEYKCLQKTITIKPYCSDWWKLLNNASMLISLSYYEGSPNVVMEAMAGKCPLIVSDINEHRELLNENSALLVPVDTPKIIALAINNILNDGYKAKERALNAYIAISNFTIVQTTNEYEKIYKSILDKKEDI